MNFTQTNNNVSSVNNSIPSFTIEDVRVIQFVAARLVQIHGESPNVDFVIRLREIAMKIEACHPAGAPVKPDLTHEYDSSRTCNYCGITAEKGYVGPINTLCPVRIQQAEIKAYGKPVSQLPKG